MVSRATVGPLHQIRAVRRTAPTGVGHDGSTDPFLNPPRFYYFYVMIFCVYTRSNATNGACNCISRALERHKMHFLFYEGMEFHKKNPPCGERLQPVV
jgi:hypothetical protein